MPDGIASAFTVMSGRIVTYSGTDSQIPPHFQAVSPMLQSPVLPFVAGMALVWAAAIIYWRRPLESETKRFLLAAFAFGQALSEWCGVGVSATGSSKLAAAQALLSAASFLFLLELARRELSLNGRPLIKWWIYPLVCGVAVLKCWWTGWQGLELAGRFAIAIPGGLLCTAALARGARAKCPVGTATALIAAAIGFFTLGRVLDVSALRAFAALGYLAGIWRRELELRPWSGDVSPIRRWRTPMAFILITALGAGSVGVMFARQSQWQPLPGVALSVTDGESGDVSSSILLDRLPTDSRQLARDRAANQRYKQGMLILVVVGVVALVWVGLSHLPRAK
jgi:hypothetical protein